MRALAALFTLLLGGQMLAQNPPAEPPRKLRLQWDDLPRLTTGHSVSMKLPDGARIQGTVIAIEPEAMVLDIRKTSLRQAWPKGRVAVPRGAITEFRLRKRTGYTWRFAGTAIGGAAAGIPGVAMIAYGSNEGSAEFKMLGAALIAGGAALGYLAGHFADRKTVLIEVH